VQEFFALLIVAQPVEAQFDGPGQLQSLVHQGLHFPGGTSRRHAANAMCPITKQGVLQKRLLIH
jgi:hypothetical protein